MARLVAAVFVAALLALPAAATASCRSEVGHGGRVVAQTRTAVVYRVRDRTPGFEQSIWYGCERRTGKLRRLDRGREFVHVSNIALAGRFVGYSAWEEDPAGLEIAEQVHVDDLRSGDGHRFDAALHYETGVNQRVRSLVLAPRGSTAWIVERGAPGTISSLGVHRVEASRDWKRTRLDEGPAIARRSLALSDDSKRIYWRNGHEARSARLR